jgi:transcriptional repressor NrdR
MQCPYCGYEGTRVVDSRLADPGDAVRRRRECAGCSARFTTYERIEDVPLMVRKRDGRRESFDRGKLLGGLLRAATKRPVTVPELEAVVDSIAAWVRRGGGESDAERIGELALRGLISLDRVAAIRFASVYRNFEDLDEFQAELERLEQAPPVALDQLPLEAALGDAGPSDSDGTLAGPPSRPARRGADPQSLRRRDHAGQP